MFTDPFIANGLTFSNPGVLAPLDEETFRLLDLSPGKTVRKGGACSYTIGHSVVGGKGAKRLRSVLRLDVNISATTVTPARSLSCYLVLDSLESERGDNRSQIVQAVAGTILGRKPDGSPATNASFDVARFVNGEP